MDRMIYTAMSGAQQSFNRQAIINHNLANVSTAGFRGQLDAMRAVPVQGAGAWGTRVSVMTTTPGTDFTAGPVEATGRDLDVALSGNAWLAVQDPAGAEAYTRQGDLQVSAEGLLTSGGSPVMGEGGPIIVPLGAAISLGSDGTVSAIGAGDQPDTLVDVGRLKLVTPADGNPLQRGDDGLFRARDANGNPTPLPADADARLQTGALEGSNVSAVASMVDMISSARQYEMQMKVVQSSEDNARQADQLLSV
ncbi:MAG TPA: flagellar basal body rod protein FlgF [Rhodanobacteraceae bacterium]|nr:flagellar basal body rod protein FlgF [Rhodanobacteraceae bacterium]